MKRYTISLVLMILATIFVSGQVNPRPGYIITNQNDTIHGIIDFRTADQNAQVCKFRLKDSITIKRYLPGEIYAYRFTDDGKFYVTRTVAIDETPTTLFLEYLIKGTISLYSYRTTEKEYYFFENEEGRIVEVSNDPKAVIINGTYGLIRNTRYIGVLTWLFNKSENITKSLKTLHLNRKELSEMTKQYHYETCQTGENCIEFETESDKKYLKVTFNAGIGIRLHTLHIKERHVDKIFDPMKSLAPSIVGGINISVPRLTNIVSLNLETEASGLKVEKGVFRSESNYSNLRISSYNADIRTGLAFRLSRTPIYPTLEGGFCETFLWGTDVIYSNSRILLDGVENQEKYSNEAVYKNYIGFYISTSIYIPLKKGAFIIQALYEQRKHDISKMATWAANVKYAF